MKVHYLVVAGADDLEAEVPTNLTVCSSLSEAKTYAQELCESEGIEASIYKLVGEFTTASTSTWHEALK